MKQHGWKWVNCPCALMKHKSTGRNCVFLLNLGMNLEEKNLSLLFHHPPKLRNPSNVWPQTPQRFIFRKSLTLPRRMSHILSFSLSSRWGKKEETRVLASGGQRTHYCFTSIPCPCFLDPPHWSQTSLPPAPRNGTLAYAAQNVKYCILWKLPFAPPDHVTKKRWES